MEIGEQPSSIQTLLLPPALNSEELDVYEQGQTAIFHFDALLEIREVEFIGYSTGRLRHYVYS